MHIGRLNRRCIVKNLKNEGTIKKESVFLRWCQVTSCHGVNDCITSKSLWRQILWILVIIICFSLMIYEIQNVLSDFINQEKWTTKVYKKKADNITYPSVVICNYNRLSLNKTKKFNFTGLLLSYFLKQFPLKHLLEVEFNETEVRELFHNWSEYHGFHTWESIFEKMGSVSCDMIPYISAGENVAATQQICDIMKNATSFFSIKMVYTREFGQCMRLDFNPEAVKPKALGTVNGISMILYANFHDYLDHPWFNLLDEGFALKLMSSGGLHGGEWLNVATGWHFVFSLTKQNTILTQTSSDLFPPPCVVKPKLKILEDGDYTRATCVLDCELQVVAAICGCVNLIQVGKHPTCDTLQLAECAQKFLDPNKENVQQIEECESECLDPCEEEKILVRSTSTRFPSRSLQEPLKGALAAVQGTYVSVEDVASGAVVIDFYYKSKEIQVVERYERITIHQLISNLGGQLGLWIGISVITIYQTILYLCHGMYNMTCNKKMY